MSDLAKKLDGSFRVTGFQLSGGRAHAAKGVKAAGVTNGFTLALRFPDFEQFTGPAFSETPFADVVAFLMGDDADGHVPDRIDGATSLPAAANVFIWAKGAGACRQIRFHKPEILGFANGIEKIQADSLLG
jgi:hypothetical protein